MNRICILAVFLWVGLPALPLYGQDVEWSLIQQDGSARLQLTTPPPHKVLAAEELTVFVGNYASWPGSHIQSILGQTNSTHRQLTFTPTFPFRRGVSYTAFWGKDHPFLFEIPLDEAKTELTAIYPSATTLPANLLKIYLHFSAPMGEGQAYEHLVVVDAAGDTIYQPFVPLQPELWSPDRRRLTLWLDPGRVKRGLLSHETHGVVITEGQRYTLLLSADWKDAAGKPLGRIYRKSFEVGPPDYAVPEPAKWRIVTPEPGSTKPLELYFGEILDHALATRLITVEHPQGKAIAGSAGLTDFERTWQFRPHQAWEEGTYYVRIDNKLEDLAGNNLRRPFDRDLTRNEAAATEADYTVISFRIESPE